MRVLVVAQYYTPEPVPKPSDVAEELTRRGHSVTVLTGLPNYPSGVLAPGYKMTPRLRESIDGVPVLRVFEYPYHGRSAVGRALNYISFSIAAAAAAYAVPRPDVMYVFIPPPTLGVSAWFLGALRRAPFICDVQDIWPDEAIMSGILHEGVVASALRIVERFVYAKASHLLVATDGARSNLLRKGIAPKKVTVLPHWYPMARTFEGPTPEFLDRGRRELQASDRFVVTFAGNLGILKAFRQCLTLRSAFARGVISDFVSSARAWIDEGLKTSPRRKDLTMFYSSTAGRQPRSRLFLLPATACWSTQYLGRYRRSRFRRRLWRTSRQDDP